MRYIMIFQTALASLLAHGREHEHMHFFGSLHVEYFALFTVSFVSAYIIYSKFFKRSR